MSLSNEEIIDLTKIPKEEICHIKCRQRKALMAENIVLETQLKETQDLLVEACEYVVTLNEEICKSKYDCYSINIKNFLNKPEIKQLLEQRKIDE